MIALPVLGLGSFVAFGTLFSGSTPTLATCSVAGPAPASMPGSDVPGTQVTVQDLDSEQLGIADTIKQEAARRSNNKGQRKITAHDTIDALMTAYQESRLRNLNYGDRDSLGVYQQRSNWGTAAQRLNPKWAVKAFFNAMVTVPNRDQMSYLDLAIAVQHPSRAAYLSPNNYFPGWQKLAEDLAGAAFQAGDCTSGSAEGYVSPFSTKVFPSRVDQGVDYCMQPGDPILAIGDGEVIGVQADWYAGQPFMWYKLLSGSMQGKYVYVSEQIDILVQRGRVKAGQTIARFASSGTCIEIGFADEAGNTLARSTGGYSEGWSTAAGVSFNTLMTEMKIQTARINPPVHGSVAGKGLPGPKQ
jgi:murein DD-endopeptidase MepM/ murein hydrolase activator NlpD